MKRVKDRPFSAGFLKVSTVILVIALFGFGCSSSNKAFTEDNDSAEDSSSKPVSDAVDDEGTDDSSSVSTGSESDSDAGDDGALSVDDASEDDALATIECGWDVGWKSGVSAWGSGSSTLQDVRVGTHSDYDRFVLEFDGDNPAPENYNAMWLARPMSPSGGPFPVDEPAGEVFLEIRVGATYSVGSTGGPYAGPSIITDPSLLNIQEAVNVGEFDGQIVWLLGANEANGFRIFSLEDPPRLVVDVCAYDGSKSKGADCLDSGMPPALCDALFSSGYSGPHAEHMEYFGSGDCPTVAPISYDSVSTSYFSDLDGDGDDEEAFTYVYDGELHLRILNGPDEADYLISASSFGPGSVIGALDLLSTDSPQLFVEVNDATPALKDIMLFELHGCSIVAVTDSDTGGAFSLPIGYVPAAGASYGIKCITGDPVLQALDGNPTSGPPATVWAWTTSTYELQIDADGFGTMASILVSETTNQSSIPWATGLNDCIFE